MATYFTWKIEKTDQRKFIAIYKENALFGKIPNLSLTGIAFINGKYFVVQEVGSFFNSKICIVDPKTKIKLCEIARYSDHSYHAEINGKSKYLLTSSWYYNDTPSVSFVYNKKLFSPPYGTIEVKETEDVELLIYCAFYIDYNRNSD